MPQIPKKLTGGSKILSDFAARNQLVVKRNELIQNTRFNLTTSEQKLILHLIQQISPKHQTLTFKLDVHKYTRFLGVGDNTVNIHRIKRDIKKLQDKSFWLDVGTINGQPHEQLVNWFALIDHNKATDEFTLQFDDRLKPFLLKTKQFFTKYNYYYIMAMRSKYSIRLYELFVSYYSVQNGRSGMNYSLDEILHMLDLDNNKSYHKFYNLNRRVLKPAIHEINKLTDFNVRIKRLKHGHAVYGINILLTKKNRKELMKSEGLVQNKLNDHSIYSNK